MNCGNICKLSSVIFGSKRVASLVEATLRLLPKCLSYHLTTFNFGASKTAETQDNLLTDEESCEETVQCPTFLHT